MSKLAFNGDGGKTDEYGTLLVHQRLFTGEVAQGCLVAANSSPSMGVRVQPGTLRLPTGTSPANYWYEGAIDTASPGEAVTVSTANPSNPRRDYVVAYIDKGVTRTTSVTNNANLILKLAVVAGTAASSPSDPTSTQITATIGASNPYIILARISVGTGVTQITNADITDLRTMMTISPAQVSGGSTSMLSSWQPWTPAWSANTIGNSVVDATYTQIGKTVHFRISLTVGSTSNFGLGVFAFSLPVPPHTNQNTAANDGFFFGTAKMLNVNVQAYTGVLKFVPGGNSAVFIAHNASGPYATYAQVTNTVPFSTTAGSIYTAIGSYEAA